jgi:hypothetical protein
MGIHKCKGRRKIEALTKQEQIKLLNNNSLYEVAGVYNVSYQTVKTIYDKLFENRDIGFGDADLKKELIEEKDLIIPKDIWMKSKERLYLQTIKKTINYEH